RLLRFIPRLGYREFPFCFTLQQPLYCLIPNRLLQVGNRVHVTALRDGGGIGDRLGRRSLLSCRGFVGESAHISFFRSLQPPDESELRILPPGRRRQMVNALRKLEGLS